MYNLIKKVRKHDKIIAFFLACVVLTMTTATLTYAQADGKSLSGDEICGTAEKKCTITDLVTITKRVLTYVIALGIPVLMVFVVYRLVTAWFAEAQGKSGALKEARTAAWNAATGFFFIVALFGGLMLVVLQVFGVKDGPLQILKMFSEAFVTHAHAQTSLPNYLGATSLYEVVLSVLRLVMRFAVYPMMIAMWVWAGFAFVMAQGNPDGLNKAKKWLWTAFLVTLVVFMLQTLLIAAQGTVNRILPGQAAQSQQTEGAAPTTENPQQVPDSPSLQELTAACTARGGSIGSDKKCYGGLSAPLSTIKDCTNKAEGTLCIVTMADGTGKTGTCADTGSGKKECTKAVVGDPCITTAGVSGAINASSICDVGQRPLVGKGGSCRADVECGGTLSCVRGTCQ